MRHRLATATLLGIAMVVSACSGAAATPAPATPAPATPAPATEAPASAGGEGVAVALGKTSLGTVVVDGTGMTLYIFTPDDAGDSTCYDDCEKAWPVLAGASATVGDGLVAADFGTTTRTDGSSQITFKGWPLYYFAGDKAAGDVAGQGLGGKWYVVDATGAMIGADAASPAAGGVVVNLASTSLGDILVDGEGMTLYMFTADSDGASACSGDCLANWPVLAGEAAAPGAGLDAKDFASITRDDGSKQLTFFGMPLYYFAGDKAAGDVNGQGVGEKWYVLEADGTVVK